MTPTQSIASTRLRAAWLRWTSFGLAGLGALDSIYLTWIKVSSSQAAFCAPGGGCDTVNNSPYSEIGGIPISLFGLGMYLALGLILAVEGRWPLAQAYGPLAIFGLSLTGTLYSAYLTYLELFVIHAVCPYCVVSAILITLIFGLAVVRLAQNLDAGQSAAEA